MIIHMHRILQKIMRLEVIHPNHIIFLNLVKHLRIGLSKNNLTVSLPVLKGPFVVKWDSVDGSDFECETAISLKLFDQSLALGGKILELVLVDHAFVLAIVAGERQRVFFGHENLNHGDLAAEGS